MADHRHVIRLGSLALSSMGAGHSVTKDCASEELSVPQQLSLDLFPSCRGPSTKRPSCISIALRGSSYFS